jgi:hypothetical protein
VAAAEQEVGEIGRVGAVRNNLTGRYLAVLGVALVTWWLIYGQLASWPLLLSSWTEEL